MDPGALACGPLASRCWPGVAIALLLACAPAPPPPSPVPAQLAPQQQAQLDAARPLLERAEARFAAGDWRGAVTAYEQGLVGLAGVPPAHDLPDAARHNLTIAYVSVGRYDDAAERAHEHLEVRRAAFGDAHPRVAGARRLRATALRNLGEFESAAGLYEQALAAFRRADAPIEVAVTANLLGTLELELGRLGRARALLRESIELYEATTLPADERARMLAEPVNNLAVLHGLRGEYARAHEAYTRARDLLAEGYGRQHAYVAAATANLALNHVSRRDYAPAQQLFQEALAIQEAVYGGPHRDLALTRYQLGALEARRERWAAAERAYQDALTTARAALDAADPLTARIESGLATLHARTGRLDEAAAGHARALARLREAFGARHHDVASVLGALGDVARASGRTSEARQRYEEALSIHTELLPGAHPAIAGTQAALGYAAWAGGDLREAQRWMRAAAATRERDMEVMLTFGSEAQRLAYADTWIDETDAALSLHLLGAPDDQDAAALALELVLQRKGRVLDALAGQNAALRARLSAQDRELLDRIEQTRTRLATLARRSRLAPDASRARQRVAALERELRDLEARMSRRSPEFRRMRARPELARVRRALPADGVLVEMISWRVFDPAAIGSRAEAERRYAAYVLHRDGRVRGVDLGPADEIDAQIARLRRRLRNPMQIGSGRVRQALQVAARAADRRLLEPLLQDVPEGAHLLLAPDGALHLLPFGALADRKLEPRIHGHTFTYLTSGRELLLERAPRPQEPPLLIGDPSYGEADRAPAWTPLPATRQEVITLAAQLPDARVALGEDATEARLRSAHGPSILHVATHGFFEAEDGEAGPEGAGAHRRSLREDVFGLRNPLLRSGLVLSGANRTLRDQADDGLLTALEASGLDLLGTQLVVLSACDTGVGRIEEGEGVFGLRRALAIAGARTQVMSLWPVSDVAALELMRSFYEHLLAQGRGRSEALRAAQLDLIAAGHHPIDWAAFVLAGDWAPLR